MPTPLAKLLQDVQTGRLPADQAEQTITQFLKQSQGSAVQSLGFATIDHDRADRCGSPEVIYGQGKTPEQVLAIADAILEKSGSVLATRLSDQARDALERQHADNIAGRSQGQRSALLIGHPPKPQPHAKPIPIVAAGTTDLPVADEAALTCAALGQPTHRVNDVGVAGLHRLLTRLDELQNANVIIVVAGMEAALPSVLAGLVHAPLVGVPTSVGYGTHFNGITALLGMLNACGSGVTVVNIDNGFGAGFAASKINRLAPHA